MLKYVMIGVLIVALVLFVFHFLQYQKATKNEDPVMKSKKLNILKICSIVLGIVLVVTIVSWLVL